ncbi:ScbR family autoregulator-binding transcription factor [Arthrobacter sp. zg-Y916]|uniref:ScbR family autoregulator-binding transcription factor n=1 Tax=Arthrobacter sp. zg-Y916 TaxID=2894190 RepID=UPI002F4242A0
MYLGTWGEVHSEGTAIRDLQDRAKATRDAILAGAALVFEEYGYGRASLSQVADRAKVTKGALYFHFPSKEDLARAVITEQHSFVSAQNEELLKQGFPPLESMILMCRRFAANLLTEPMVRAGSRLTLEASSFDEDVRQPYEDWIALMGRLAREAQQRGELRGDLDPDSLARFVVSSLTGVHIVSAVLTDRADLLRRVDEMWAMLLPGVVSDDVRDTSRELIRKTTGA